VLVVCIAHRKFSFRVTLLLNLASSNVPVSFDAAMFAIFASVTAPFAMSPILEKTKFVEPNIIGLVVINCQLELELIDPSSTKTKSPDVTSEELLASCDLLQTPLSTTYMPFWAGEFWFLTKTLFPTDKETPSICCVPDKLTLDTVAARTDCLKSKLNTDTFSMYEFAMLFIISRKNAAFVGLIYLV
jgi:hypothetical protein